LTQRLNITNGDSAAGTLSEAGVEGKILPWRDVLHEGPVDSSLSLEELSKVRARFISGRNWDDFAHDLRRRPPYNSASADETRGRIAVP